MTAEEFKKYEGRQTTGTKGKYVLSGGKIIGYDPNSGHHLQLFAIDDNLGDCGKSYRCVIPNKEDYNDWLLDKHKYIWVSIDNVIMDEQKELDLTEILKGCEGVELWSDIFGKCKLESLDCDEDYKIIVLVLNSVSYENKYEQFTKYGRFYDCYPNGKCILWPSETNRDWSTFKKPLKADDWVVACDGEGCGHINKYCNINRTWKYVIPFEKYNPTLTDEELKKLSIV